MTLLASVAPKLLAEIHSALSAAGYETTASQLEAGTIERCTYDDSVEAGYVYLVRPEPSLHFAKLAAPVAKTLTFLEVGFNVDIDHDGNIFGVEFLDRPDFVSELRYANVL